MASESPNGEAGKQKQYPANKMDWTAFSLACTAMLTGMGICTTLLVVRKAVALI